MGAKKPVIGYSSISDAIRDLSAKGYTARQMQELLNISSHRIRVILSRERRVAGCDSHSVIIRHDIYMNLKRKADRRGEQVPELINRLLRIIAEDDLYESVLDEDEPLRETVGAS